MIVRTINSKEETVMNLQQKLILASASPRRRDILRNLGLEFDIMIPNIDETMPPELNTDSAVEFLSVKKAKSIANKIDYPAIIIGSDTTVAIDGEVLGKPVDKKEAFDMLKKLSGRSHEVISGYAIVNTLENRVTSGSIISKVYFDDLSDEQIQAYISTGEPMDKAGAYAIQGYASTFIPHIEGCYNNIVGLPTYAVCKALKENGINVLKFVPA